MKRRFSVVFLTVILVFSLSVTAFAHKGRTDSHGGHRDNDNQSGLGAYHYHCGGYRAHLHTNGVCPYKSGTTAKKASIQPEKVVNEPKPVAVKSETAEKTVPSKDKDTKDDNTAVGTYAVLGICGAAVGTTAYIKRRGNK